MTAAPAITIGEFIDESPLGRFQITTIVMCAAVLVLDGFATQSIGFLAPSIAQSLHVPVQTFGPVFAAALFGLMLASLVAGPIADRVGRKVPIIAAAFTFGVFTIATGTAANFHQLVIYRFLTGLGLGAAIPNVVALVTEYAPRRSQQIIVTTVFCGMPFGALLGGLISTVILPRAGWRAVLYAGGAVPIGIALVLIWLLPESLRFLSLRESKRSQLDRIVARLNPGATRTIVAPVYASLALQPAGAPVAGLFQDGRAAGTLLLWIPFFMNLLLLYFIVNWLPALLRQTHVPVIAGILGVSLFSFGGMIGSFLQGYAMKRYGARQVLLCEFVLCFLLVAALGWTSSFAMIMIVTFLAGCFVQGAQGGINAVAATFYPTSMRSTGVGWALGVGRLGSIVGPVVGGTMLLHHWSLKAIFLAGSLPAVAAAIAILISAKLPENSSPYRRAAVQATALPTQAAPMTQS